MNYRNNNIILILVMVISIITMMVVGNNEFIKYSIIALDLITIGLLPSKYAIQNCFFMISFPAVYDIYGFKYLFNITMLITFLKLLFTYKKIDKRYMLLLFLIVAIETFDAIIFKKIDFDIIPFFSLIISFITLSLGIINSKKNNVLEIYQSLFWGLIISSILAITRVFYMQGGFSLSIYSRFIGFFRDPNYYSFFILLTGFSSYKIVKSYNIKVNYFILILLFGFLSLSKMFLLSFVICVCFKGIQSLKFNKVLTINKEKCFYYFLSLIFILIGLYVLIKNNYIKEVYELYYLRFQSQDLTTGRFDIASIYINAFKSNPFFLLIGTSNTYYYHVISDYMRSLGNYISRDMTAHNFFIELIASWGIIGTLIFISIIKRLIKIIKNNNSIIKNVITKNIIIFAILFTTGFSLCFLSADCFPLIILFVLIYLFDDRLNLNLESGEVHE